jgi:cytochrome c oxidase cbb3-type subunit 3
MHDPIMLGIAIAAALCAAGCATGSTEAANTGSPPAVEIPVGPIPGPGRAPAVPTNPYSANNVALSEGRQLFVRYNCYGCHGGHGGGGMGPSLRDPAWIYGDSDALVFDSIAQGRAHGMPAWGTKIPQDQIWKLTAYIKSMGSSSEPQPPPPFPNQPPEVQAAAAAVKK